MSCKIIIVSFYFDIKRDIRESKDQTKFDIVFQQKVQRSYTTRESITFEIVRPVDMDIIEVQMTEDAISHDMQSKIDESYEILH